MERATLLKPDSARAERRAYRPRELARMYSVAPQTVYAWIYSGKLKANRIGRVLLVPAEEVERWFGGEEAA